MDSQERMKHAKEEETGIFRCAILNGDIFPTEFDTDLNFVQHEKIAAYIELCGGSCWIGKINLYKSDSWIMKEITKRIRVYNFDGAFIIPEYDIDLEWMILARSRSPYTGTKSDYVLVEAIIDKIDELDGHHLHWV